MQKMVKHLQELISFFEHIQIHEAASKMSEYIYLKKMFTFPYING